MTKEKNIKKYLLIAAGVICSVLLGLFLTVMQTRLSVTNQEENTRGNLEQVQGLVDSAYATAAQNEESYDEVYQSKAATVAYMANKDSRFIGIDLYLKQLATKLNVTNILLLDKEGNVTAKAKTSKADFTKDRYNQLRTVFDDREPSKPFDVDYGGEIYRYYGAYIDANTQVVIEHDPAELRQIQADINSWESMLSNVKVGLTGYSFAVSSKDFTILYHPDETLIGKDSINEGLSVANLEDGFFGWMNLQGQRLYCGVSKIANHDAYVICAVPEAEMISSRHITVGIVLFVFLVVMLIVLTYAFMVLKEQEEEDSVESEEDDEEKEDWRFTTLPGGFIYNKDLGRRLGAISLVGLVVIFVVSFYMQTLFSLSLRSISNNRQMEDVIETFQKNEQDIELLTSQYNRRYLNKCQTAADILSSNPELKTREELANLSRVLGVEFIILFDKDGHEIVSDSSYVNFTISDDPAAQSYEFNRLLQGLEYVVQEPMNDDISGEYHQYIGSLLYDSEGMADGFVQISIYPEKLEEALAATQLSEVLDNVKASAGGFAFAVDKETQTFAWYPQSRMIGKNVLEYGMTEDELRDNFCDFITIDNADYYAYGMETADDYLYVVTPDRQMNKMRFPVALVSTIVSLGFLLVMFILLTITRQTKEEMDESAAATEENSPMFDVELPDGRIGKTESAASRWANNSIKWDEKTPEQKIVTVLKAMMSVLAIAIGIAVVFKDRFFGPQSIFLYIINGEWHRGVNIFALTGCIMIICVVSVFVMIFREILRILSKTFGARGETVCRMLRSFAKYISFIAVLYYCFALVGVDTQTLLASAGILSLVIGLGAKTLVSDILAGLFIIFEGEFQVGDIVTIGDWRGTVQEIGVRTTKIMDPGQNVKIISNSEVNGVINMTKRSSYTFCDVGIEYGESLERVENILAKELPQIKKRLPAIKDGPFYKGVVSLGDNSVNIRIMALCSENDRVQLGRDMNREMKLLFDNYDINIPFPQVVINEPKEYLKATELEKRRADAFNETQKELSRKMKEEQGEGGEKS